METKSNVITIDGTEYSQDDLDDSQTYLIKQINDLQAKSANLRFQLDQVSVAQSAFTNSLIQSLKNEEVIETMNEGRKLMVNASEVKAKLDTHEAVCAERWKETILRIKRIEHIMIVTAGTMIIMMIGLLIR
jgi:hypothetical protein